MIKTKKAVAKRFKITGSGKVRFKKAGLRHNLGNKSRNNKNPKGKAGYIFDGDRRHILKSLPHGSTM